MQEEHPTETDTLLKALFVNNPDAYGTQTPPEWQWRTERQPISADLVSRHLKGELVLGFHSTNPTDNTCKWACFDVDEDSETALRTITQLEDALKPYCSERMVMSEFTGNHWHLWVFFMVPTPTGQVRRFGLTVLHTIKRPEIEFFPKQDTPGDLGNFVRLPLGVHPKTQKRSSCDLSKVVPGICPDIPATQEALTLATQAPPQKPYNGSTPACIRQLLKGVDEGQRHDVGLRIAGYFSNVRQNKPETVFNQLKKWAKKCAPPFPETELQQIIHDVDAQGYNFGCDDLILSRLCARPETCKLRKWRGDTPPPIRVQPVLTDAQRQQAMDLLEDPNWLDQVWQRMDQHIKHDYSNRRILFKVMTSAFALKKPMHVTMKAGTSTGKTYLATEVGRYMPTHCIEYLEGMTPKSIYYDYGEWDDARKVKILDLQGRIWVFLDIPSLETLNFIKAMMSADAYERIYKTVHEQKSLHILLRGFATVIACTTSNKYHEEMSTRALTLSPEETQEKIEEAIKLYYAQCAHPAFDVDTTDVQSAILLLAESERFARFPDALHYAETKISEITERRKLRSRDMRDLKWLPKLAMVTAWLNQRHRMTDDEYIDVSDTDLHAAEEDWQPVHEQTTTGMTAEQLQFLAAVQMGVEYTSRDLLGLYFDEFGRYRSYRTLKKRILDPLNFAGYIDFEPDPEDKRRFLFRKLCAINSINRQITAKTERRDLTPAKTERRDLPRVLDNGTHWHTQQQRIFQILNYCTDIAMEHLDGVVLEQKILQRAALDQLNPPTVQTILAHLVDIGQLSRVGDGQFRVVEHPAFGKHCEEIKIPKKPEEETEE